MSKSYVVAPGFEFTYPADEKSLKLVMAAGGTSNLSDVDRGHIKFKTVKEGQDCSDMPASSRDVYLERGWVLEKPAEAPAHPEEKEKS